VKGWPGAERQAKFERTKCDFRRTLNCSNQIGKQRCIWSDSSKLNIYLSVYAGTNQANAVVWAVGDEVEAIAADLRAKGVTLDNYPEGFERVVDGVHTRGALSVIWLRDPDGNILHITSGHAN
jgi:hypothetical protein